MRAIGYILIVGGFLAGAFLAVQDQLTVPVGPFVLALIVGAVGIVMVRWATHRAATHEEHLAANISTIGSSLAQVVEDVEQLEAQKDDIDVYELRHVIDRTFPPHLQAFVEARQSIAHSYGLPAYADVMNSFAAGERNLNRVWSASTDGYIDEAHNYITLAREQMVEALEKFRALEARGA